MSVQTRNQPDLLRQRKKVVLIVALAMVAMAGAIIPLLRVNSEELPPPYNPTYIQTNAGNTFISRGDWYTDSNEGGPGGSQYFTINVPCDWPATKPIDIDLFSPEMNTNAYPLSDEDDNGNGGSPTVFEIYQPGTTYTPYGTPGSGAGGSLQQTSYPASSSPPQMTKKTDWPKDICGEMSHR